MLNNNTNKRESLSVKCQQPLPPALSHDALWWAGGLASTGAGGARGRRHGGARASFLAGLGKTHILKTVLSYNLRMRRVMKDWSIAFESFSLSKKVIGTFSRKLFPQQL